MQAAACLVSDLRGAAMLHSSCNSIASNGRLAPGVNCRLSGVQAARVVAHVSAATQPHARRRAVLLSHVSLHGFAAGTRLQGAGHGTHHRNANNTTIRAVFEKVPTVTQSLCMRGLLTSFAGRWCNPSHQCMLFASYGLVSMCLIAGAMLLVAVHLDA